MKRSYMFRQRAAGLLALLQFSCVVGAAAQISNTVSRVQTDQYHAGSPLGVRVELVNAALVDRVEFLYRSFGRTDYTHADMDLQGNLAALQIPAGDLTPPFLEYYLVLSHNGAQVETYPLDNPADHPLRIDLETPAGSGDESVIILSPEPNDRVSSREELLISFSLLRADSTVDRSSLKVFLDGSDITSEAVVTSDIVVVTPPSDLEGGNHTIKVELSDVDRSSAHVATWGFTSAWAGPSAAGVPGWKYTSNLQAETRNENIAGSVTPYNRVTVSAGGSYGQLRINGSAYVTNEETDRRQPQNRFLLTGETSWLKLGYGDHYPTFPNLIMSGKRVRGFEGNLTLGFFNLDVSTGDILRQIESDTLSTFPFDSLASEQTKDSTASYGQYDQLRWAKFQRGTFSRDLLVIRPSFGPRDGAHVGFTYLKSKDDLTSIIYGGRPRENLVFASDLVVPLDNRRLELSGQAAFSATNNDITGGTFSDARIDSLYPDSIYSQSTRDNVRRVRDIFSRFITINENLVPLNMTNTPTLAYEASLGVNYFNNFARFTYLRHGNNYESFGESYLRTDVAGFNVSDRMRLIDNQVLLTAGLERLKDNTADTKAATTTTTTTSVVLSWFPRTDAPNVTVGYVAAVNDNGGGTDPLWRIDDESHRVLVQLGKEFMLGERQTAMLSVSTSTRDDRTPRDLDGKNTTVSFSNTTTFRIPLQTQVSLSVSSNTYAVLGAGNTASSTSTDYTTLYATARYSFLEGRLATEASVSPTFGDIERTLLNARSEYALMRHLSLVGQLSVYLNRTTTNDVIWSFILRAEI